MKRKSTMCFCNKTVVCNFCSGDDNVHDLICTKTISYCKSDTRRHKHQDLVEKHWLTIGRLWNAEQGTGHWETGTLWTKANR